MLAAGLSVRFGRDKLTVEIEGKNLIEHALAPFRRCSGLAEVAVVARPHGVLPRGVQIVLNPDFRSGMASSIRAGVAACEADAWLIALGDMPSVSPRTVEAIVEEIATGRRGIVVPMCRGKRGHPVAFSARYREELLALEGDVGARSILNAHPDDVHELEVSDLGALLDLDTEDALFGFEPRAS